MGINTPQNCPLLKIPVSLCKKHPLLLNWVWCYIWYRSLPTLNWTGIIVLFWQRYYMQSIISQTHLWTLESWLQNEDHRAEFPALSTLVLTGFTLVPVTPDSQSRSHFLSFLSKCSKCFFSLLHCANQIVLRSPTERFKFISSCSFEFKIVNF